VKLAAVPSACRIGDIVWLIAPLSVMLLFTLRSDVKNAVGLPLPTKVCPVVVTLIPLLLVSPLIHPVAYRLYPAAFTALVNVPNEAAIVIAPAPLVILTFDPAVKVARTGDKPVLPITSCPLVAAPKAEKAEVPFPSRRELAVKLVAPVPPLATGSVPVTLDARDTDDKNAEVELSQLDKSILASLTCRVILLLAVATVSKLLSDLIPLKLSAFLLVMFINKDSLEVPIVFTVGNKS
jgi:hypothetical protein